MTNIKLDLSNPKAGAATGRSHNPASSDPKSDLRAYFDGVGFQRWSAIYDGGELGRVRRTIRAGHARMLALAEQWIEESRLPAGSRVLDAGCGTGLFSVGMARRGYTVHGVDIAPQMVAAARAAAQRRGVGERATFACGDLEAIDGLFDAVACFDVLVHYPQPLFGDLLTHLARRTRGPLLLTYAPYSSLLHALHWIGGRFPRAQRRTEIQMIRSRDVEQTLAEAGMRVVRQSAISHGFYHVTLLHAQPAQGWGRVVTGLNYC